MPLQTCRWLILGLALFLAACSPFHAGYVPVKHGQIEYYRLGKGTPVVLISGYLTDISSWNRRFLFALADQHEVIIFNNRHVSGSVVHSTHDTMRDLANDTHSLIQSLELNKPAVIGISMGGMIAEQYAVMYPHELGELILINTAIAGKQAVHPNPAVEKSLLNMPDNKISRYVLAVQLFFPPDSKTPMAYELAVDRFVPADYQEIDVAKVKPSQQRVLFQWIKDNRTAQQLAQLQVPTLILNGEADIVIPPVNSVILKRTIPNAELWRWRDGGHAMIYQFPQPMADLINRFIRKSSLRGAVIPAKAGTQALASKSTGSQLSLG